MTASPVMLSRFATHDASAYPGLWRGCVGAWAPGLGPSGSRLHDYSRRVNWGTPTNVDLSTYWTVSGGQYGLSFDGTDDRVDCSRDVAFLNTLTRGTISCWARFAGTGSAQNLFGLCDSTDSNGWCLFYLNAGSGMFWGLYEGSVFVANNGFTAMPLPTIGRWQHFALTATGSVITGYLDGVPYPLSAGGNQTAYFSTISGANDVSWGDYVTSGGRGLRYGGLMDDMRLYDRALTSEEIRLLARYRGISYTPASRVLYAPEDTGGGGVAKPVLFHSYYMSQGMRP